MKLCFFFKQKTAYEMRSSDWSSDVCSSDLAAMAADTDADASSEQQSERERRDEREQIIVTGQHYQTQQESPKSTRPVRDTPQTVTVITGETIEQQNLLTLREIGRASCRERVCQSV